MLIKLIALMLLGVIALVQHYRGKILAANWLYLVFDVGGGLLDHHSATGSIHRTSARIIYNSDDTAGGSNCCGYGGAEWLSGY